LASLRLAGTTLIWWQSKLQNGRQQVGNVFPSWKDFVFALRKQFYPLGYKEKALIEWQSLKLRKGQAVQEYTDEFCKMALMLNIPLHTQETLMKYIGGLPTHIRNTVFMFGPTNVDKVSVQTTYIEVGKKRFGVSTESSSRKEDKRKGNVKKQIQRQERKRSSLARISRKKGMMMTIVGNCSQRKEQSGSKKGKGGKQLQQQHDQKTWDMI
jgi:hypothetical protein